MKLLECPLLRKRDFRLYGYNFDKYEGWTCPSTSLDLKLYIWTYLILNSVKWKYCNGPCCENLILVYMPTSLINEKFELVPWCETWCENEILAYMVRSLIKVELVPRSPLIRNMICEPIWFCIRKNEIIWMTIVKKMRI